MEEDANGNGKNGGSFFACYLLTSLNPRFKGCHYIGFTVNPRRRIRQHNGELRSGAWRTHRKRPWDMVLCVYGFSTQVEALQFEWAWQHPGKSLAVKEAAARIPSTIRGLKKQFYLMFTMLNLDKWSSMDLNVQFLSSKYINFKKGCPELPPHMGLCIAPVDTLPVNVEEADSDVDKERCSDPSDTELDDLDPPIEIHKLPGGDLRSEPPVATSSCAQPLVNAMESSGRQKETKAFPASEEYAIRKTAMEDDELLPLRCRQLPSSSQSAQIEVSISPRTQENPAVQGQNKTMVEPSIEVLEFEGLESDCHGFEGMPSPEVLSPLPSESGATAMSPFSAIFEQYPLKPPSSIVKRCLQQKANASLPTHVAINEESPVILPHTPPCRSRVVVVIPDYTPISSSREVIDLTDSPY